MRKKMYTDRDSKIGLQAGSKRRKSNRGEGDRVYPILICLALSLAIPKLIQGSVFERVQSAENQLRYNAEQIEQVVVWGHKLHSHTHSYIHYGFFKAFEHLGYKTLWLNNSDDISNINFNATLFITEHQVDQKMPLRDDCYYFVHCSSHPKYNHLKEIKHFIDLDVYKNSHQCSSTLQEVEPFIFYDFKNMYFLIPWATDLLPEEIDQYKPSSLEAYQDKRFIYWVGTIGEGIGGNDSELTPFRLACQQHGIRFIHSDPWSSPLEPSENIRLIQDSHLAPAICGKLQLEKDYIPCRIFKNISYGHIGLTNSRVVYELFGRKIVYNPDTYQLLVDGEAKLKEGNLQEQYELMDFVKKHHTYVNRAQHMLNFVNQSHAYWNSLENLKNEYLSIVRKYNEGTIYIDENSESNESIIEYFLTNSPFKSGLQFSIDTADPATMRDMYLKLVKRVIRGILDEEDTPDYDRPNHPKIMTDYAYTHVSGEAFNTLRSCMEDVEKNGIAGDFVETGVWRGGITMFMKAFLHAYENHERKVWVADSFEGWPPATDDPDSWICNNQNLPWIVVPFEVVRNNFQRYGLLDDKVIFLKGWFKNTLPTAPIDKIAILRIDGDLYDSTKDALEALYPKLEVGGYVIIDDYYYFSGCDRAVNEYRKAHNIDDPFFRQGSTCSGVCWKKTHAE